MPLAGKISREFPNVRTKGDDKLRKTHHRDSKHPFTDNHNTSNSQKSFMIVHNKSQGVTSTLHKIHMATLFTHSKTADMNKTNFNGEEIRLPTHP